MTARIPVLPGESPLLFQHRIDLYRADFQPQSVAEEELVERMVHESWRIDRALNAEAERAGAQTRQAAARAQLAADEKARREGIEAAELGSKLLSERRGREEVEHTSLLVMKLESTAGGCEWLIDRWNEL
jgi:hypothetical protein